MATPSDDDQTLLQKYRLRGDQQAFRQLVDRHLPSVYGTAYRDLLHVHDAEDICQKVFTRLAQKGRHVSIRNVPGWLFTVTRQNVLDMKRHEGRRRTREKRATADPTITSTETGPTFDREPDSAVQEAFNLLREQDQKALFLRFHEELDFDEMGVALGVSQRAAQKRLYRAMDRLRSHLVKRGITASSSVVAGSLFANPAMAAPTTDLGERVTRQALVEAAATSLPILLVHSAASVIGGATLLTATLVTAAVAWQQRLAAPPLPTAPRTTSEVRATMGDHAPTNPSILPENGIAIDDLERIYKLTKAEKTAALARLETYLESKSDRTYLDDLFQRWALLDAPRACEALVTLIGRSAGKENRDELLSELLTATLPPWMNTDRQGLLSWISNLERSRAESLTFNAVLRVLSVENPAQAYQLLKNRGSTGDHPYQIVASALASRGATFTCRFLHDLPSTTTFPTPSTMNGDARFQAGLLDPRTRLLRATIPHLFQQAPQEVADWVTGLPDHAEADSFTSEFVGQWAALDTSAAAAWTSELGKQTRDGVTPALIDEWMKSDAEAAIHWAFRENRVTHPYQVIESGFGRWLADETSRTRALTWLEKHAGAAEATSLFGLASEILGRKASLTWALKLPDSPARTESLNHTFFTWGLEEGSRGPAYLNAITPQSARQSAALALAEAWFIKNGREALEMLEAEAAQRDEAFLSNAARQARIGILAALNPRHVSEEVLGLPAGQERDRLLDTLLHRTYRRSEEHAATALEWTGKFKDAELRNRWSRRVEQTFARSPWSQAAVLPNRLQSSFKAQSYREFRERLDLLSSVPPLRP